MPAACAATDGGQTQCRTHDLWSELGQQIRLFLSGISLADVVQGRVAGRASRPLRAGGGMTYLDANATEMLRPEARAAVLAALDLGGNPASVHAAGRAARRLLEEARETIAARFGGRPADLVFTSGGTEADALAVHALGAGRRLIVGATEHDAVRSATPAPRCCRWMATGVADLEALRRLLAEGGPALVCLMLANNETGALFGSN